MEVPGFCLSGGRKAVGDVQVRKHPSQAIKYVSYIQNYVVEVMRLPLIK